MTSFSIELGGDFCHLREIYPTNTEKIIGYCYKKKTKCYKHNSKKEVNKTAEATEEVMGKNV